MTYPHHVKANGRYYAPGEEIKTNSDPEAKKYPEMDNRGEVKARTRRKRTD